MRQLFDEIRQEMTDDLFLHRKRDVVMVCAALVATLVALSFLVMQTIAA
jgi:hypothetical protein